MGRVKYFTGGVSEITEGSGRLSLDKVLSSNKSTYLPEEQSEKSKAYSRPNHTYMGVEVEEIAIRSPLYEGFDKTGEGILVDGMVYGKAYVFEVVKFRNGAGPIDESSIKWAFSYETEEGIVEGDLEGATGALVSITLKDLQLCGRRLSIYAYIYNRDGGAFLSTWVHYRFRYFSRAIIEEEVEQRLIHNYLIEQNATSLCGMAAIFYIFLKETPNDYRKIALELHQKGQVTFGTYIIKPRVSMYDMQPFATNTEYPAFRTYSNGAPIEPPQLMPLVDWMVLASARSSLSLLGYGGRSGEDFSAINWGRVMKRILKSFMGYTVLVDKTTLLTGHDHTDTLIQIQRDYDEGYQIILLIDSDMLNDSVSHIGNAFGWHYIVFEGDLLFDVENKRYQFSYYTWGQLYKQRWFRAPVFDSNCYGYYKIKR